MKITEHKGKSILVRVEEQVKGKKIKALMKVDSQGRNHVYSYVDNGEKIMIPFSSMHELNKFLKVVMQLKEELVAHNAFLNNKSKA